MDILSQIQKFDRDKGNIEKNWKNRRVSYIECKEVYLEQIERSSGIQE